EMMEAGDQIELVFGNLNQRQSDQWRLFQLEAPGLVLGQQFLQACRIEVWPLLDGKRQGDLALYDLQRPGQAPPVEGRAQDIVAFEYGEPGVAEGLQVEFAGDAHAALFVVHARARRRQ